MCRTRHWRSYLLLVVHGCVDLVVRAGGHEVSVQDGPGGDHLLHAAAQLLHAALQEPVEPVPVLGTDQAVLEHPAVLMVPEPEQLHFVLGEIITAVLESVTSKSTYYNIKLVLVNEVVAKRTILINLVDYFMHILSVNRKTKLTDKS